MNLSNLGLVFTKGILFIVLICVGVFVVVMAGLIVRRKKKFNIEVIALTPLSDNKVDISRLKAGWFRKKRGFFNLIEFGGGYEMITNDNRTISNVSSEDFHFTENGGKCLIVMRRPDDPEILIPISRIKVDEEAKTAFSSIPPADFRDVAVNILERKQEETMSWFDKNKGILVFIFLVLIGMIIYIVTVQRATGEYTEVRKLLAYAIDKLSKSTTTTAP